MNSGNSGCGNGKKDENENCDDMNVKNGDGCSSKCEVEQFWFCEDWPSECTKQSVLGTSDSIMEYSTGVTAAVSVAISGLAGILSNGGHGTIAGIILYRHYAQIGSLKFVNANLPPKFKNKVKASEKVSFDFTTSDDVQESFNKTFGSDYNKRSLASTDAFSSSSFLVNRLEIFFILLVILFLTAMVAPLLYFKPGNHIFVLRKIYEILKKVFFFGIYLAIIMEGYFFGCLYVFFEFYVAFEYGNFSFASIIFSLMALFILIALPITLVIHYSIYWKNDKVISSGFLA